MGNYYIHGELDIPENVATHGIWSCLREILETAKEHHNSNGSSTQTLAPDHIRAIKAAILTNHTSEYYLTGPIVKASKYLLDGCIMADNYFSASYPKNQILKKEAVELVEYGLKQMFGDDWENLSQKYQVDNNWR